MEITFNKVLFARLSLAALFLIVTVLQVFSFPGQFAHMRRVSGISLLLEILLTVLVAALFLFAQTMIVALPLDDVTAKQRSGEALDGEDATLDIWAGQIPIITKFGEPITNADSSHVPVPEYIRRFGEWGR